MDGLDVIIEDTRWADMGLEQIAAAAVPAALAHLGLYPSGYEVAILACDDTEIARLNTAFRAKPKATNVLSWPSVALNAGDPPQQELGDIAIAYDSCLREAAEQDKPFSAHVSHLLVHATLHLLGYDHEKDTEAAKMERLEVEILGKLGLPDPY